MIRAVVDDLAFLPVDAVVRPADDALDPITPAIAKLDQQAGPAFAALRRVQSPLGSGAAVVTGAGDLAASFVVHVVIRSESSNVQGDAVRRALISAWQRAAEWQFRSVAAPLVGVGAGQLSLEEAATLLVDTFLEQSGDDRCPAELSIVVEREEDRLLAEAIIERRRS